MFKFKFFLWVVCRILVRIEKTLQKDVSSDRRILINLFEPSENEILMLSLSQSMSRNHAYPANTVSTIVVLQVLVT